MAYTECTDIKLTYLLMRMSGCTDVLAVHLDEGWII